MGYVSRDVYGRFETHKASVPANGKTCDWCGNVHSTKLGHKYLYKYWIERDGLLNTMSEIKGRFCSIGCMKIYHGLD